MDAAIYGGDSLIKTARLRLERRHKARGTAVGHRRCNRQVRERFWRARGSDLTIDLRKSVLRRLY